LNGEPIINWADLSADWFGAALPWVLIAMVMTAVCVLYHKKPSSLKYLAFGIGAYSDVKPSQVAGCLWWNFGFNMVWGLIYNIPFKVGLCMWFRTIGNTAVDSSSGDLTLVFWQTLLAGLLSSFGDVIIVTQCLCLPSIELTELPVRAGTASRSDGSFCTCTSPTVRLWCI
jgi:hypothetical protein